MVDLILMYRTLRLDKFLLRNIKFIIKSVHDMFLWFENTQMVKNTEKRVICFFEVVLSSRVITMDNVYIRHSLYTAIVFNVYAVSSIYANVTITINNIVL